FLPAQRLRPTHDPPVLFPGDHDQYRPDGQAIHPAQEHGSARTDPGDHRRQDLADHGVPAGLLTEVTLCWLSTPMSENPPTDTAPTSEPAKSLGVEVSLSEDKRSATL